MEKVSGQCHAEEECHLSQNAMGKAKENQMAPTKTSLSVNKYADCFLLEVRDFSGAANKAYADMARRTLRIKAAPNERDGLREKATAILESTIEELKRTAPSSFRSWHEKTCEELIACYGEQPFSYGQAQKWLNMLLKYLYVYGVQGYEGLFTPERIDALDMAIDSKVIDGLHKGKYKIRRPALAWSKWDKDTYLAYQHEVRAKLKNASDIENEDERIPFYWELINWPKLK